MLKPRKYDKPFRVRVQQALLAEIAKICPDLGYTYDLRPTPNERHKERVFMGRFWYGDSDPLPMVGFLQTPLQPDPDQGLPGSNSPHLKGPVDFVLQGWVADDDENPTLPAEYLLADIEQCLANIKKRATEGPILGFNGLMEIRLAEGVVRPPDELSAKAYFWLPVTFVWARDLSDPYNDD